MRAVLLALVLLATLAPGAPGATAQPELGPPTTTTATTATVDTRSADWLRTVRDTPLWSGPNDPAVQFSTLPLGSFLQPRAGSDQGRLL
ncbi:MAG TPA: hypothetical protein VGE94_04600, partial [Chloroflexota bacterium]